MKTVRTALVGDYDPRVTAHRAIPGALELAGRAHPLINAFVEAAA